MRLRDCESLTCENSFTVVSFDVEKGLHVPMPVRECTIDYLMKTTCIYICFFIMSLSVQQHKQWFTVRDMRLSKCSIIILKKQG